MKRMIIIIACGMAIIIVYLGCISRLPGPNYLRSKRIAAKLNHEFPVGTDKTQILAFLDKEGIEHSKYHENDEIYPGRFINAIIRDTMWGLVGNADMIIKFSFDNQGKLQRCDIDTMGIAP